MFVFRCKCPYTILSRMEVMMMKMTMMIRAVVAVDNDDDLTIDAVNEKNNCGVNFIFVFELWFWHGLNIVILHVLPNNLTI